MRLVPLTVALAHVRLAFVTGLAFGALAGALSALAVFLRH